MHQFSPVQSLSCARLFVTPWTTAHQASLVHHHLSEFAQTHVHRVSDAIQPSHSLSSPSPPAFNLPQHQGLFLILRIRWPKYWSFSFSISPSNEYSGLISFRTDWFNLLEVQRTLKSHQHHSSKASILWHSAFFIVQLSLGWASLVAQMVKRLPAMWETRVRSLGGEDLLEKEMATHSSTLAWSIPPLQALSTAILQNSKWYSSADSCSSGI